MTGLVDDPSEADILNVIACLRMHTYRRIRISNLAEIERLRNTPFAPAPTFDESYVAQASFYDAEPEQEPEGMLSQEKITRLYRGETIFQRLTGTKAVLTRI